MSNSITRVLFRPKYGLHHEKELHKKFPKGDWVVWWYSTVQQNREGAVHWARMLLRRLEGDRLTDDFHHVDIALTRLGLYQPGTILLDGRIGAKVQSEERYFEVNFSVGGWEYKPTAELGLCSPDSNYKLPGDCGTELVLVLKQPKGRLFLNCLEYFVRGYSNQSEVHRILTTFGDHELRSRLYDLELEAKHSNETESPDEWTIFPKKSMVRADAKLLALYRYENRRTVKAINRLYNQFGRHFREGKPQGFLAEPWFDGPATLKCRGVSINGGQDFLCTELVGRSLPSTRKIIFHVSKGEQQDTADRDQIITSGRRGKDGVGFDELTMTDAGRPGSDYPSESIETGDFELIGENDVDTRYLPVPYQAQKAPPSEDSPPTEHSTGEGSAAGDKDTGKLTVNSRAISAETDGFLWNTWNAFKQLHDTKQIKLQWFVPPKTMNEEGPPECITFSERQGEQAEYAGWLDIGTGTRRAMLLLYIEAQSRKFLVVELQRKPYKGPSAHGGESFCGLICQVDDLNHLQKVHSTIDDLLPKKKGVFRNISASLPRKHYVFQHRSGRGLDRSLATATLALKTMEIAYSVETDA